MPLFDYTGQLQSGATFRGTCEAQSREHAEATLRDMGVRVTSLRSTASLGYQAPLSLDDFLFFNEQVAAMTRAGVPLGEGLRGLAADTPSRKLKRVLLELADALESGTPLPDAIERIQSRFPTDYAGVVRAGLQTGDLGASLYGLTAHLRLKGHIRRALGEVMLYPLVILLFTFGLLTFMMRAIVPEVERTINDFGVAQVPRLSELIFDAAHAWPTVELAVLAAVAGGLALALLLALPPLRGVREAMIRAVPGVSRVYWSSVLARFTHTSALAAFAGVPLPLLVETAGLASGSPALRRAMKTVRARLESGESLEAAVHAARDVPALWSCVVTTAGPRGELPAALAELARNYEARARQSASTVRVVLGPMLLLIVGATLGALVIGMLLPLVSLIRSLTM